LPIIHDLNHVANVRAADPAAIDALMARIEVEFAGYRHRQIVLDTDTPNEFEARLVLERYDDVEGSLLILLARELRGSARAEPLRPITTEADWTAYARLKRLDWAERAARLGLGSLPEVGEGLIATYRAKVPPLRYWLALVDGEPRGFFSSWEGPDGLRQGGDLFLGRGYRHRRLATSPIPQAVAGCRPPGAGPIAIIADFTDTPKTMYAAMGFRPVVVQRKHTRHVR